MSTARKAGLLALTFSLLGAGCQQPDQPSPGTAPTEVVQQALGGELRPFPQGGAFPGCPTCIKPAVSQATMNADVKSFYNTWKANLLRTYPSGTALAGRHYLLAGANGNVNGWPSGVTAVSSSEAHGYLMIVTALMAGTDGDPNARTIFDSANALRKALPSSTDSRLMQWVLPSNGSTSLQKQGPATDGDLDMAYALLLAYNQWGDVTYLNEAKTIIAGMEAKFITSGTGGSYFPRLNIGDPSATTSAPPESKPYLSRPSDYMIGHFRAFHQATGNAIWQQLETGSLNILNAVKNASTGLVPDFLVGNPPVPSTTGTGDEGLCYNCYDYNACRVPWRQAAAVAHYGTTMSKTLADQMVTWAKGKYGNPTAMKAGARLNGDNLYDWTDSAFTSPMVVGAIVNSAHQTWLNSGWTYMKGTATGSDYYGGSITLLSMLLASGNWWRFEPTVTCTAETDAQFCARLAKNCGSVTAADNCGTSRTVASCGTCTAPATCGGGGTANVCGTSGQAPYGGTPRTLPGTLQAEDYDTGGQGIAYNDTTSGNSGGQLRTDNVDIGQSCGTGCYNIGWAAAGEWTEYTVDIASSATFTVDLRVAATATGRTMHVEVDGVDETGPIAIPNTGSYNTFQTTTPAINIGVLAAGQHVVRVVFDTGSVNLDWVRFTAACTPEADGAFCSRLGKNCGTVTGNDNCGTSRTVTSCGTCTAPQSCGGGGVANVCGTCTSESDAAFCARLGKNCGSVTGTDNCGLSRTATCGSCTAPQTCGGGGTTNVCGCTAESNAAFCARVGASCGAVMGTDNCGAPRSVASCGSCTAPQSCGGGGTPNSCGCTAESDAAFCARLGKNCGSVTGTDNCGAPRTASDCGTCTAPATCGGGGTANVCGTASAQQPYGGTARAIPGTIQAEDYDTGGQGVAYNDTTPTDNTFNVYRDSTSEGVDVESKTTGQYNIGAAAAGEWVEYTVNATAGAYDLQLRVATNATRTMHVELDGTNVSGTINVPNTTSYSTFQTVTVSNLTLTAGQKVMRVVFDSGSVNLDWVAWVARTGGGSAYHYFEAENGVGSSTAPMSHVTDANASGGKCIWSATTSSTAAVPTNGHVTFSFNLAAAGTYKVWGRFLVGPATTSDDSLWIRIDSSAWIQWNNIHPRVGTTTAYAWDAERNSGAADAVVTRSLTAGAHTLEIAYRENGLKMDRFLVTNDLAFTP